MKGSGSEKLAPTPYAGRDYRALSISAWSLYDPQHPTGLSRGPDIFRGKGSICTLQKAAKLQFYGSSTPVVKMQCYTVLNLKKMRWDNLTVYRYSSCFFG